MDDEKEVPRGEDKPEEAKEDAGPVERNEKEEASRSKVPWSERLKSKKKPIGVALIVIAFVLCLPALAPQLFCNHEEWSEPTCTEPATCKECGKTKGEPLGHEWEEATCSSPKTCKRCGEEEGEALGHEPGEWTHVDDYVKAVSKDVQKCTRCGELISEKNKSSMTSFVGNEKFSISAHDYTERLNNAFSDIKGASSISASMDLDDSGTGIDLKIRRKSTAVAVGSFYVDSSTRLLYAASSSPNVFSNVVIYFGKSDASYIAAGLVATICAADPSITTSEARQVASAALDGVVEKNGVTYGVAQNDGWWISARIE